MIYTGIPCFIALHKYCVFYKLKVCGSPAWSKSLGAIFPTAFAHFTSLRHILVILAIFQILHQQKDYDSLKVQMLVSIF